MAEELGRRVRLQSALDVVVGEGRNPKGELGFGHAGLNDMRLDEHVIGRAGRQLNVVEPHVAEGIETPGFHGCFPLF